MGDRNFNNILPSYINSKIIRYFTWSDRNQNPNFKNQKPGPVNNSQRLHETFSGSDNLHILHSVKGLTAKVKNNSSEESLESDQRFLTDNEDSVISLDTDSNSTIQQDVVDGCTPVAEPCGIRLHPLFRNILYIQKKNQDEHLDEGPIITELRESQFTSKDTKCSSEDISECRLTKEIMRNPFRRNSSSRPVTPAPPPQVTPEWTHQVEQVWIKFAESLPSSLRTQTTLNIAITVGFTLVAWLFLSWVTQLIVSFICVSVAIFFLSAILSPQTNSWFIANFVLSHMDNLRHSLSDLFLKFGEWLRPPLVEPNHNQRQNLIQPQIQNQNRRLSLKVNTN